VKNYSFAFKALPFCANTLRQSVSAAPFQCLQLVSAFTRYTSKLPCAELSQPK